MILLAEISDKMPTIDSMWFRTSILAFIAVGLGVLAGAWRAWLGWLLALALTGFIAYSAYNEAYLVGDFSSAVWEEMGPTWVAHSLASGFMPFLLLSMVLVLRWRERKRAARAT